MIRLDDGYSRAGQAEANFSEIDNKIAKGKFCSLKVAVRKTISRWNRELLGKDFCFELEEGIFSFLVTRIDKETSKFGVPIEGFYLERSNEDKWWHVNMVVSKNPDDDNANIRICRCFAPHYATKEKYELASSRTNAPL